MKLIIEKSKGFFVLCLHFGLSGKLCQNSRPAHHHRQQQHVLVNGPPPLADARDGQRGVFEMLWASQTRAAAGQMETKASESVKFSDLSDAQDDSQKDQTTSSC